MNNGEFTLVQLHSVRRMTTQKHSKLLHQLIRVSLFFRGGNESKRLRVHEHLRPTYV